MKAWGLEIAEFMALALVLDTWLNLETVTAHSVLLPQILGQKFILLRAITVKAQHVAFANIDIVFLREVGAWVTVILSFLSLFLA